MYGKMTHIIFYADAPHHHHRLRARLGDLPMPIVRKPLYIMRNRIRAGGQARPDL
jgi:hypothetical protein